MLIRILKTSKRYLIADLIIWLITHNLPLLIGVYTKDYFDNENPLFIVCIIGFLILLRLLFINIGARIDIKTQQQWAKSFYNIAYTSLNGNKSNEETDTGEFLNALNEDVDCIISTMSYAIDTICNIIYGILAIIILSYIHMNLTIYILVMPVIAIIINNLIKHRVSHYSEIMKKNSSTFSSNLNYLLQKSRMIRVNNLQKKYSNKIKEDVEYQKKIGFRYVSWISILNSVTNMITECNILVILFVYMQSDLTAGSIILFITYSFDIAGMSQYISSLIVSIQSTKVYLKNFEEKFPLRKRIKEENQKINKQSAMLDIKKGEVNIIIGENASGKSTYLRFLNTILPNSCMLPEKYTLMHTTIKENISLGESYGDVRKYAKIACVDIDLEFIFNNNLSGGQVFRIVLARTIYHAKEYVLIDHNFTSVDENTRIELFNNLASLGITVIFTDHINREIYKNLHHIYM